MIDRDTKALTLMIRDILQESGIAGLTGEFVLVACGDDPEGVDPFGPLLVLAAGLNRDGIIGCFQCGLKETEASEGDTLAWGMGFLMADEDQHQ